MNGYLIGYLQREASRVLRRCANTGEGLAMTWREEASFSQWVAANVANIALALMVDLAPAERALVIACGLLVLVVELLNTGIEAAIDRISTERHPLSKKAKDAACAAVACMAGITGVVWVILLAGQGAG